MQPFRYHVFVCTQVKPEGLPSCTASGGQAVLAALQKGIVEAGLDDRVQLTPCGSLGLCARGPNIVIYPDGIWYSGVKPSDVPEIIEKHFRDGTVVSRLLSGDEGAVRSEICENRARARQMLQLQTQNLPPEIEAVARGFMESRALLTALELDLFSAIKDGATANDAAQQIRADPRATESLLNAIVAMNLATKQDATFRPTPSTARFLTSGSPESVRAAMLHTVHMWDRWNTLTDAVRAGTSVYTGKRTSDQTEAFIAAMHRNASVRAASVANALDLSNRKRLLDVGGGSGAYSIAFAQANENLRCVVFDLGPVTKIAERHIAQEKLSDRVTVQVGDLRTDEFGTGYDLVFLSAILHMLSPEENVKLLKKAHGALVPGGELVIQDFIMNDEKTAPRAGALFALNMLVATKGGSSYSEREYRSWLRETGFGEVRSVPFPGAPTGLVIGVRT